MFQELHGYHADSTYNGNDLHCKIKIVWSGKNLSLSLVFKDRDIEYLIQYFEWPLR